MKKKCNMKEEEDLKEGQDESMLSAESVLKPIGDLTILEASQFHEDL